MALSKTMPAYAGVVPAYSVVTQALADFTQQMVTLTVGRYLSQAVYAAGGAPIQVQQYQFTFAEVSDPTVAALFLAVADQTLIAQCPDYAGATEVS